MYLATSYGPFANVVSDAAGAIAAVVAVGNTWRGRAKWEPSDIDLPMLPQRLGGVVALVILATVWITVQTNPVLNIAGPVAIGAGIAAVFGGFGYLVLVSVYTFDSQLAISASRTKTIKIIGGLWLTQGAKNSIANEGVHLQAYFKGTAYDPDYVWPRLARGLAKVLFLLGYLVLTTGGTIAVAMVGILLGGA